MSGVKFNEQMRVTLHNFIDSATWFDEGGVSLTQENIEDFIATFLVAGNNVDLTYNDVANTLTIDVEALTQADIASLVADLAAKQPLEATLTAIASVAPGAGQYIYFTALDTPALDNISALGRNLIDDGTLASMYTTLGFSAFFQTLVDDADAAAFRTTIGVGNKFGTIAVSGQSDVVADAESDTLTLAAGANVTITTTPGTDTVTIAAAAGGTPPSGAGVVTAGAGILNMGVYEASSVIVDAIVTAASRISLFLAPSLDTDENDPELLDIASMVAVPATGSFTAKLAFLNPVTGPVKIQYMVA